MKDFKKLFVWYLGDVSKPVLAGHLTLVGKNNLFTYSDEWIETMWPITLDMPLSREPIGPKNKRNINVFFEDCMPDRWGMAMINTLIRPPRRTVLDYLYYAGDTRFGAFGFSLSETQYIPCEQSPILNIDSLDQMTDVVDRVLMRFSVTPFEKKLIDSSRSMGGARPKALVNHDGKMWIAKFPKGDLIDIPLLEHATAVLARKCGINIPETRAEMVSIGHVYLIERFDRIGCVSRKHVVSANTALSNVNNMGYADISNYLIENGGSECPKDIQEVFRRMVFNALIGNTDDHEKNHAFTFSEKDGWCLAPGYDIVSQIDGLPIHAIRVGENTFEASYSSLLSEAESYNMSKDEAKKVYNEIYDIVSDFEPVFKDVGMMQRDVDEVKDYMLHDEMKPPKLKMFF